MHWILQNNIFSEAGWDTLLATLERFSIAHSTHKVVPFVGELHPAPQLDHRNVICFGSYSMRHVARRERWQPGVFDLFEQDFQQQLLHWGSHMLNAGSVVTPFADAVFGGDEMFIRPVNDSKYFAGKLFGREEFVEWQHKVCRLNLDDGTSLTPQTLIQLAPPVTIHAEYRFWVVKGEIVTKSLYKRGDRVIYSSEVDERFDRYVRERIAEWMPHESFVIDVCDTPDGMRIVEINTLNAAGFYAADVQRLVLALEEAY
ncbi:MAG TPA: ATP-grasp domain-containing protein [Burkholderiaceae bacterium]